jgi:hypothetical protein
MEGGFSNMKRKFVLFSGLFFMTASQAVAVVKTELFLDAGSGTTATVDVSDLGIVTCSGTCGGLIFPGFLLPHTELIVEGTIGQFTIDATGVGGLTAISPTLQDLNQIEAASSGSGTLFTEFTDTDYCMGGGKCFGNQFVLSASTVNDTGIAASTTSFASFADASNAVPAGTLIGSFMNLTGLSDSTSGTFANPIGTSGSLSTATSMAFAGSGEIQANFQISTAGGVKIFTPEPASIMLFGSIVGLAALKFRRKTQKV